ncbi:MAG: HAD family hydrolase [Planctomycetes bacterium]|nr:HAD family hydrolase [Planctomycetota bacterium]
MSRGPSAGSDPRPRRAAVIFDLDGTLTRPHLDFDAIRAEIGLGPGPILESLAQLHGTALARAEAILHRHERDAAENAVLQEGAVEVVSACRAAGYRAAIVTRNSRVSLHHVLHAHAIVIDAARTREDGAIKPSPEPILSLCAEVDADPHRSWMIGDYLFDILSGRAAGARTVLMIGDAAAPEYAPQADHVIRRLAELLPLLSIDVHGG